MTYSARSGFNLIEILVALVIVGLVGMFGISLLRQSRDTAIEALVDRINRLTRLAYLRALTTGKLHRVYFNLTQQGRISVEEEAEKDSKGVRTFKAVSGLIVASSIAWDPRFTLDHFYINGIDEIGATGVRDVWLYVFPTGTAQDIMIDIQDQAEQIRRSMVLNPFSVRFTVYHEYQAV